MISGSQQPRVMPCLITKWIKSLVCLIQVTLSCTWIVSLQSSLRWLFTSLPAPPFKPPPNGLGRKERKMIGSSWCPEVSLLLLILAEGPQEDPVGPGRLGWAPVHAQLLPGWELVSAEKGPNSPDNGLQTRGPGTLQSTRGRSGAQSPDFSAPPQTRLPLGTFAETCALARETHVTQSQVWPLTKTRAPQVPRTFRWRQSVSCRGERHHTLKGHP